MAYHTAKSQLLPHSNSKTYLSATIPTATYERLISKVATYPSFVLPLPRPDAALEEEESIPDAATDTSTPAATQRTPPHEFYFMQWGMHGSPPTPLASSDVLPPFFNQLSSSSSQKDGPKNPTCTTVLFTSLQEYKLRQDYATPHLIITHYTDFAQSHGLVLFRGELTPSPSPSGGSGGRSTVLSPDNAQRLALLLQQFYLPPLENDKRGAARAKLLQRFHEEPEAFCWEDLVDSTIL
jgi:ATP synthase F1 complex assembly factor 1